MPKFKYQPGHLKVQRAALTFLMQDKTHHFNNGRLNKNLNIHRHVSCLDY